MDCCSGRGCHLSLVGDGLSVAVYRGLPKGWLGLLHVVRAGRGLRQCCFQGCLECKMFGGLLTIDCVDCIWWGRECLTGNLESRMPNQFDVT